MGNKSAQEQYYERLNREAAAAERAAEKAEQAAAEEAAREAARDRRATEEQGWTPSNAGYDWGD